MPTKKSAPKMAIKKMSAMSTKKMSGGGGCGMNSGCGGGSKMMNNMKNMSNHHFQFLLIIVVFSVVSLYTLVSFFNSTNNYIKLMEANVLQSDEVAMEVSPYEIFVDVKSDHQYAKAIEALKDAGVIGGYDDDSFKPEKTISRAEFLSVVANALDADFASGNYFKCFKDVEGQWFEVPVCYAKEKGWVKGGAENYGPTADVLSQEALKMITLAFEFDYEEAEKGQDWYIPFLNSAIDNKVITEKEFTYGKVLSRGQFAELLYKAMVAKDLL